MYSGSVVFHILVLLFMGVVNGLTLEAMASRVGASITTTGLWVCDPAIRGLLEEPAAAVSRGELLGRCRRTFTNEACDAAQNALARGPSVLSTLQELCGPQALAGSTNAVRNPARGVSGHMVGQTGMGWGPLDNGVDLPSYKPKTSFRGPASPPLAQGQTKDGKTLDETLRGKTVGKRYDWEMPSRANSSQLDRAADAVRVFDQTGLGGGSKPLEGANARQGPGGIRLRDIAAIVGGPSMQIPTKSAMPQVTLAPELEPMADEAAGDFKWNGQLGTWAENSSAANANTEIMLIMPTLAATDGADNANTGCDPSSIGNDAAKTAMALIGSSGTQSSLVVVTKSAQDMATTAAEAQGCTSQKVISAVTAAVSAVAKQGAAAAITQSGLSDIAGGFGFGSLMEPTPREY